MHKKFVSVKNSSFLCYINTLYGRMLVNQEPGVVFATVHFLRNLLIKLEYFP